MSDPRWVLRAVSVPPSHYLGAMGRPRALLTLQWAALWALGAAGAAALRIGAFNIQSFGDSKVLDSDCASVIAQVRRGPGLGCCLWALRVKLPCVTRPYGPLSRSWLAMTSRSCRRCETRT